jgi:lysozyme
MQRLINNNGLTLIKSFEGCQLKAYPDPASPLAYELRKSANARRLGWEKLSGEPWTVGWGSTGLDTFNLDPQGKPTQIGPSTTWTQAQADQRKSEDLALFCDAVSKLLKVEVNDNQFAALVSFAYNAGAGNLKNSTLLRLVNQSNFTKAADEFLKWTKAQGKELPGLVRRREAERRLFLTPV